MAYAVASDVQLRVGGADNFLRLFDRDGDGVADSSLVSEAIKYGETIVNAKLAEMLGPGGRFDTPGPVPDEIRYLTSALAASFAGEAFPGNRKDGDAPYAFLKTAAMQALEALRTNSGMELPTGAEPPESLGLSYVSSPATPFDDAASGIGCGRDSFWTKNRGSGGRTAF